MSGKTMQAMILAAGLGTRLRPCSLLRPKPLFPVLDVPLIELIIGGLQRAGFSDIVINCHHLKDMFVQRFSGRPGIVLQVERHILGTGGALRRALPRFGDRPVLVVNGDIYHDLDYSSIYRRHCQSGAGISMVLHDHPRFNTVQVDEKERVDGFRHSDRPAKKTLAFTGIQVLSPRMLELMPAGTFYGIIEWYCRLLDRGETIQGQVHEGLFWSDIGTPADYLGLHAGLLSGRTPVIPELAGRLPPGTFYAAATAAVGKRVRMEDWAVVGSGARIGAGATIRRSVVWDGAAVAAGATIKDTIITDGENTESLGTDS